MLHSAGGAVALRWLGALQTLSRWPWERADPIGWRVVRARRSANPEEEGTVRSPFGFRLLRFRQPKPIEPRSAADEAMDRYAKGDDAAFSALYDALAPKLHSFLLRQTGRREVADDLLQQTFLLVHQSRGHFLSGARVCPWLYAITRRLLIDGARRGRFELCDPAPEEWARACEADAESAVSARQLADAFARRLDALPSSQREAFRLVRMEGLSVSEAAEVVGVTPTALKLRLFRAMEAFREVLE